MLKKLFCLASLLFLASSLPLQPVFANESVVFGPARYERGWGKPKTVTKEFTSPECGSGFKMEIRNGDFRGRHRVSSGTVTLNGKKVVTPCDFNHHAGGIKRAVSLESSNELAVTLKGSPGSFITVTIVGARHGPTVNLSASPQSIAAGGSSTLSWISSGAETCEIDHGVGSVPLEGSTAVAPSQTTTYTITAVGPGGTSTASATVTVLSQAPVANDDHASTPEDTPISVDVLANDAGSGLSVSSVTQGVHGLVSLNPDGTVTYTPEPDFNGEDSFTYTARDSRGGTAAGRVSVTVNPANDAPVADNQSISTDQDAAVSILLAGSDPDGDSLSFSVAALPAHGSLAGTPPRLTYTPDSGYHGADSFTFKVSDGALESQPATVSITVNRVNHPPTAVDDAAATGEGKAVVVSVLANDRDPDGDLLRVSAFTQGSHGSVGDGGNDALVYTPTVGFSGEDSFTYSVSDGNGGSASGTVRIKVNPLSSITLRITSPLEGEFIAGSFVMVQGIITNPAGHETGVTVGGVTAQVFGSEFVANHVPLQDGENIITAAAMDVEGNSTSTSVSVTSDSTADYIEITADIESGISPLDILLHVRGSFDFADSALSYSGPGAVEILETAPGEYRVRLTTEGPYLFTAEAVDSQGAIHTDTTAIMLMDRERLDALLKDRWNGMKNALAQADIQGALAYFLETSRDRYGEILGHLAGELPGIASAMREIQLVYTKDRVAKYRIKRLEDVQGQIYDITYTIYFVKDPFGIWRIESF